MRVRARKETSPIKKYLRETHIDYKALEVRGNRRKNYNFFLLLLYLHSKKCTLLLRGCFTKQRRSLARSQGEQFLRKQLVPGLKPCFFWGGQLRKFCFVGGSISLGVGLWKFKALPYSQFYSLLCMCCSQCELSISCSSSLAGCLLLCFVGDDLLSLRNHKFK